MAGIDGGQDPVFSLVVDKRDGFQHTHLVIPGERLSQHEAALVVNIL